MSPPHTELPFCAVYRCSARSRSDTSVRRLCLKPTIADRCPNVTCQRARWFHGAPPASVAANAARRWASSEETVRQAVLDRFSAMDPELAVFLQQYSCVTTVCQMPPFDPNHTPAAAQHRVRIKPERESCLRRAPVHPMSRVERDEMRKQLDCLLRRGLIQPSAENSASPAFFIRKRAGAGEKTGTTKLRLIIDVRMT